MTSNRNSSSSYAYYSFPPTPSRDSPSTTRSSERSSPQTARSTRSTAMAPTPAAGTAAKGAPETPTKTGKNPASSATPTLGKEGDSTKETASAQKRLREGHPSLVRLKQRRNLLIKTRRSCHQDLRRPRKLPRMSRARLPLLKRKQKNPKAARLA